jgi:hypothetical protein
LEEYGEILNGAAYERAEVGLHCAQQVDIEDIDDTEEVG